MKNVVKKVVTASALFVLTAIILAANPVLVFASSLNIWWPTNNAVVNGTQPFKAIANNLSVDNYQMFWQVDNGQWNFMANNFADYPHKEASVDLSGWNWHGTGPYNLNFLATDFGGNIISQQAVQIYTGTAPATSPQPPSYSINIISPADAEHVSGAKLFKASLNQPQNNYQMFWQVDTGQPNQMQNSSDGTNKKAIIDFSGWNWKGAGPYIISFIAKSNDGSSTFAKSSVSIYVDPLSSNTNTTQTISLAPALTPFYWDKNNDAAVWVAANQASQPANALLMEKIATEPQAVWFGDWNGNVASNTASLMQNAKTQKTIPIMVLYNIPERDCGGYSAGGSNNPTGYMAWIQSVAEGIGKNKAVVVLEPDALPMIGCLSSQDQTTRLSLINYAVTSLKTETGAIVYIDAGHPNWIDPNQMANLLNQSGIGKADGFSLNVSNFTSQTDNINYGNQISSLVGGKHFVIDTSRDGNGPAPDNSWCNPSGRALGTKPTTATGISTIDAFLWLKTPGESDGTCNGGPSAGVFWPDYALGLASGASY